MSHTDLVLKQKAWLSKEEAFLWFYIVCSYVEDTNSPMLVKCYNFWLEQLLLLDCSQRSQLVG